jgi:hypothetical protein
LESVHRRLENLEKQSQLTYEIGTQMTPFIPTLSFLDSVIERIKRMPYALLEGSGIRMYVEDARRREDDEISLD